MTRDVPRERVHRREIADHVGDQQKVLRGDDRRPPEERRRHQSGQRRVRMVGDRRAERMEEISAVEVGESRRGDDAAHPPQVPQEAVVVARIAGHRIVEVTRQRPGPRDRQRAEQRQRSEVLHPIGAA